ncbi:MAG: hypothetical protein MK165_00905 [Pirellulaceae bacterium]|nr:hypothetical protein [Pirellulaceae bacterium]
MPRYVILHHRMPLEMTRSSHWDLMLSTGKSLRTWALPQPPAIKDRITAEQLVNHRLEYLDYEGPVSNNRGDVNKWDAGTYEICQENDLQIVTQLEGDRLTGQLTLSRDNIEAQRWTLEFCSV